MKSKIEYQFANLRVEILMIDTMKKYQTRLRMTNLVIIVSAVILIAAILVLLNLVF